jgi:group I intron endonuclease
MIDIKVDDTFTIIGSPEIKKTYIYKIINNTNGKIYIGKTRNKNPRNRWREHLQIARNKTVKNNTYQLIHKSINKYGKENFTFEVIEECISDELGCEREKFWIKEYKTFVYEYGSQFGYNLTAGGDGSTGFKHSKEAKEKMSKDRKGTRLGKENTFYGKHHTEETKQKIRGKTSGRKLSIQEIEKRSKLTVENVLFIRSECDNLTKKQCVVKKKELSRKYNISVNMIRLILKRERWANI